eukprot:scaffold1115_cov390-Prasinococcus_capsulatus_cf.AAC.3
MSTEEQHTLSIATVCACPTSSALRCKHRAVHNPAALVTVHPGMLLVRRRPCNPIRLSMLRRFRLLLNANCHVSEAYIALCMSRRSCAFRDRRSTIPAIALFANSDLALLNFPRRSATLGQGRTPRLISHPNCRPSTGTYAAERVSRRECQEGLTRRQKRAHRASVRAARGLARAGATLYQLRAVRQPRPPWRPRWRSLIGRFGAVPKALRRTERLGHPELLPNEYKNGYNYTLK